MTNYTRRALGTAILDMGSTPIASTKSAVSIALLTAGYFFNNKTNEDKRN